MCCTNGKESLNHHIIHSARVREICQASNRVNHACQPLGDGHQILLLFEWEGVCRNFEKLEGGKQLSSAFVVNLNSITEPLFHEITVKLRVMLQHSSSSFDKGRWYWSFCGSVSNIDAYGAWNNMVRWGNGFFWDLRQTACMVVLTIFVIAAALVVIGDAALS